MSAGILTGGGLVAALVASTCCVVPLSLGALGIGGALLPALASLAPYQSAFRVAGILLLAAAFWLIYQRPQPAALHSACAVAPSQRLTKTALWIGAAVMGLVLTSGWRERAIV